MRKRFLQFSIRSLLCFVVVIAGLLAFLRTFGSHLLWVPNHFAASHASLIAVESSIPTSDESFVQCSIGGIHFTLPESMAKQMSVTGSASDIWIKFTDANRQVAIQFPQYSIGNTSPLRQALMPIPDEINQLTTPRLVKEICDCSSDSFSWKQSRQELQRHQWAITQRREQGVDVNNFGYYRFRSGRDCDWILLSCDVSKVDCREQVRSLLVWEHQHPDANGQIHFGDATRQDVSWIATMASSLRWEPTTTAPTIDVMPKTYDQILSMIEIDPGEDKSN